MQVQVLRFIFVHYDPDPTIAAGRQAQLNKNKRGASQDLQQ